jgi:hypothetical protein
MSLIIFILLLALLILVHELGHFSVAKFFKIKVEEFGIGFPPRLLSIKRGETVYSLNLLFFGGFVKSLERMVTRQQVILALLRISRVGPSSSHGGRYSDELALCVARALGWLHGWRALPQSSTMVLAQ